MYRKISEILENPTEYKNCKCCGNVNHVDNANCSYCGENIKLSPTMSTTMVNLKMNTKIEFMMEYDEITQEEAINTEILI